LVFEVREGTQKNFVFKTNFGADWVTDNADSLNGSPQTGALKKPL